MTQQRRDCTALVQLMQAGGYYQQIMAAGPELDRVKAYLRSLAGHTAPAGAPLQYPDYPLFPGLRHVPFHPASALPGAMMLERHAATIAAEWEALACADHLSYLPPKMRNHWGLYLFQHMGVCLEPVAPQCPRTHTLLRGLPGICLDYPWGDALFSVHAGDSHLAAHCSVDNLRVRCHLGLRIPPGCTIRVGSDIREWEEGRALLFEDSFEHEVWNRSAEPRAILIVDFWHPDLTALEIEALTAGFRKSEVRRHIMGKRLAMMAAGPDTFAAFLGEQIARGDADAVIDKYWSR